MLRYYASSLIISLCSIFLAGGLNAQGVTGARGLALGGAVIALEENEWAVFGNPALLPYSEAEAAFYGIRNYGLAELTDMAAAGGFGFADGAMASALAVHRYGDELFSEMNFRLIQKITLKGVHLGVALNYNRLSFGGSYAEEAAAALGLDAGLAVELAGGLLFGMKGVNLNRPKYAFGEDLPAELGAGISYQLHERMLILMDVVKDVRFPASVRSGLEAELTDGLFLRSGFSTQPGTWSAGFGLQRTGLKVDFGIQQHPELGLSPGLSFAKGLGR
jgi:hypothetical protein